MKLRAFGRTGLEASELVFGGGFVGGLLLHQPDDVKLMAVERAVEAGINWIDTAPGYGNGKSEEALGWILPELEAPVHVSTKVRLDPARLGDIRGEIERSIEASLERLKRDGVDLLQLHNPIAAETGGGALACDLVLGPVADALDRVREDGLTEFIGLTALGEAGPVRRAIESRRFHSAQVYYNLINPSAARLLPPGWSGHDFSGVIAACTASGTAVMAIRVFAAGVLATDRRHGREIVLTRNSEMPAEEARTRAVLAALGTGHGTRAQAALRFVLANRDIACAVIGLAEPAHLEEALAAAQMGPLPQSALTALDRVYAAEFQRL